MPLAMRPQAIDAAGKLASGILIICRGRDETDPPGQLPKPLTRADMQPLSDLGLSIERFEDFDDPYDPGLGAHQNLTTCAPIELPPPGTAPWPVSRRWARHYHHRPRWAGGPVGHSP